MFENIRAALKRLLYVFGPARDNLSMREALARCRQRDLQINTIIDIGASNGQWSLMARKFFPDAHCFLIEAQSSHENALEKMRSGNTGMDYIISAAGDRNGSIYFDAGDLFGGLASNSPLDRNCISVPVVTVDSQVRERNIRPPFLLKLDTHGFEVPIFEGARETLKNTALIVVEVYNFKLTSESLRFHELCHYMESLGFRCIDICDPMYRPKDKAFWQMDMLFVPVDRKEFLSNSYE